MLLYIILLGTYTKVFVYLSTKVLFKCIKLYTLKHGIRKNMNYKRELFHT